MKKISVTEKSVRDLSFLRELPREQISLNITKYLERKGEGQLLKDISVPHNVFVSIWRFTYEGRHHSHSINLCVRDLKRKQGQEVPQGVQAALDSMRLDERAWFNFKQSYLHGVEGLPHGGCHFCIEVTDIKYLNADNFASKKLVSEELRKEGAELFAKGKYQEAMKKYRRQINISEGVNKKVFSPEELTQVAAINQKAKVNFLRCFGKCASFDDPTYKLADEYSKQYLGKENNELGLLLRAQVLMQQKYFTDALDLAEALSKTNPEEGAKLAAQIKQKKSKLKN